MKRIPNKHSQARAHYLVSKAIKEGKLKTLPCEKCGEKAIAHHTDYSKPLDVMWLCRKHHMAWHKKYGYFESEFKQIRMSDKAHRRLKIGACEKGMTMYDYFSYLSKTWKI